MRIRDGSLSVQMQEPMKSRTYNDFRSLLCSPEVADIEALCRYERSILRKEQSITNWVDGDAQMGDVNINWDPPAGAARQCAIFWMKQIQSVLGF